jgi:hypothetical protein
MRFVLRLFGVFPILTLDVAGGRSESDDEAAEDCSLGGGSSHNFERDVFPLSPTQHHEWEWDDRKKGFGFR